MSSGRPARGWWSQRMRNVAGSSGTSTTAHSRTSSGSSSTCSSSPARRLGPGECRRSARGDRQRRPGCVGAFESSRTGSTRRCSSIADWQRRCCERRGGAGSAGESRRCARVSAGGRGDGVLLLPRGATERGQARRGRTRARRSRVAGARAAFASRCPTTAPASTRPEQRRRGSANMGDRLGALGGRLDASPRSLGGHARSPARSRSHHEVRVLVADDQAPFRRAARAVVRCRRGLPARRRGDLRRGGASALVDARPDLVLMDIGMAGIGGIEAAR